LDLNNGSINTKSIGPKTMRVEANSIVPKTVGVETHNQLELKLVGIET
jgi:hypothetical protein